MSTSAGTAGIDGRIKPTIYVIRNMLPDRNLSILETNRNDENNYSHRYEKAQEGKALSHYNY